MRATCSLRSWRVLGGGPVLFWQRSPKESGYKANVLSLAASPIASLFAEKVPRAPESRQLCRLGESSSERLVRGRGGGVASSCRCNTVQCHIM